MNEKIGTIKGIDLIKKSAPKANISFRTGKYMTEKDRPRDKSYKKEKYKLAQLNWQSPCFVIKRLWVQVPPPAPNAGSPTSRDRYK